MRDLKHNLQLANGLDVTLSGVTPATGNIVDRLGFESTTFFVATRTVTDAGASEGIVFEVQHSDTTADADFGAVPDEQLIGKEADLSITTDDQDNQVIGSIGYIGSKQYCRLRAVGSTGTNAEVVAFAVKGHANIKPTAVAAANIAAT